MSSHRDARVRRVILIEAVANAVAAGVKAWAGFATGSFALLSDAIHSLADLANNGVAWLVAAWSAEPPDEEHPYGHRKFESIAVFFLATLLVVTAFEVGTSALARSDAPVRPSGLALGLMLIVVATNAALALWEGHWARRLSSDLLGADARHTWGDVATTLAAVAGWLAGAAGYAWADTAAALAVSALILYLAYGLFQRSLPILVDRAAIDPRALRQAALRVPGVHAVRDVRSRSYGNRSAVDLTVVVAAQLATDASHEIATEVERSLAQGFPLQSVSVHIEPLEVPG